MKKQHRLGQWNGRRKSSRSDEAVLPRLWQASVLARLVPVFATMLAVTFVAHRWPAPLPHRVGEISPRDLRVRVYFERINQPQTDRARDEAAERLPAAEANDPAARERARRAVPTVLERFPQGTLLVPAGQPISEQELEVLTEENVAFEHARSPGERARHEIALFCIMSLLAALIVIYVARFQLALAARASKIVAICALAFTTVALALLLSRPPWYAALLPLTLTALLLTIAYNPQFALLMSFSLALATAVALGSDLSALLVTMGGTATAVLLLRNVRTRTRLVQVAAGAGAACLVMSSATGLLAGQTWTLISFDAARQFAWASLAGFLLSGALPVIERLLGIVTDVSLLELADGSHPLLQELIRRAPGTYTHSMTVATLAEPAAEAIGANPLLTRVGSFFHDVGKMLKPHYFVENQAGENRHDDLEPALSTLVIIGHVKDGVALAREYNLPRPVTDFIQQHHGTTLVEYFYHEAIRLGGERAAEDPALEASFRYPGPKPQSREIGILMIADAVESTSRALAEPTPSSLRKLVHDLLMKRLLDGQFEESGLTLTELHLIEESLSKSLTALYHSRVKYPETRTLAS